MSIIKSRFPDVAIPSNITIPDFVFQNFDKFADSEALIDVASGRTYTFAQIKALSYRIGSALTRLGFKKGDTFAVYSPNLPEYHLVFYGVLLIGGIVTTTNPLYTADELATQLEHSGASYVVTVPPFAPKALQAKDTVTKIKDVFVFGEAEGCKSFASLLQDDGSAFPKDVTISDDDVAMLPYSSGTTGLPKGVQLTHRNIVSVLTQSLSPHFYKKADPGNSVVSLLPMYHIFGLVGGAVCLHEGIRMVMLMKFEPETFLKSLQDYKTYHVDLVPPLVLFLVKHPIVDKFDLSALVDVTVGAAPLGEEITTAFLKKFPQITVRQGYGLTETSPTVSCSPYGEESLVPGSAGCLVQNTEMKVIDTQSGEPLPPNSNGELLIRGPQVMKGYLNNPEATANTIDKEGFLHTGDLAYYREDGYIFIVDRLKELIKYKGNQVAPAELEATLLTHPGIADAAVIGIADEEAGELPKAFVVKKPGNDVTEEDICKFVAGKVAPTKKLRGGVEFIASIPKNPSGKILRRQLKEQQMKK